METSRTHDQLKRKNWILLGLLLALMVGLYGMSFIKFGQTVTAQKEGTKASLLEPAVPTDASYQ